MGLPLKQYWALLAEHINPQKVRFALLALLVLSTTSVQIVNPQIVRRFIDTTQGETGDTALLYAALAFIGLALLQQILAVGATYVGANVAWTATNALRAALVRHCLRLDMGFHNDTPPGELIEKIDGDVSQLGMFFSQFAIRLTGNLLLLAGILVALALEDVRLGAIFTVLAAILLLAMIQVRGVAIPHQKARRQATTDLFGYLEEQLAGTEDIRSSGAVSFVLRGLYEKQYTILQHSRKASQKHWIIGLVSGPMMTAITIAGGLSGYYLYTGGAITIGTVYLIIHYIGLLGHPIRTLTYHLESLQTIGASVERLTELRNLRPRLYSGPGATIPDGAPALTFEDVAFAYVEDEPVLNGITFRLEPGRALGLLGRTGSGKTTLARLVFRLYEPTAGRIALDGEDIRRPRLESLRGRVALVTQDVQLFQASVRDNLTLFNHSIPDDRIRAVIKQLELSDWYAALPEGLDTQLETGGRGLSAGEAQLLAFTRVFLRDPGLVILDEASSRLDPATERRVEHAVDKLLQNRTAIIIAHRLTTLRRADEVMILDEGRVLEHGRREQLAADPNSRFYRLLQTGLEEVLA